jgi:hypothetical protein
MSVLAESTGKLVDIVTEGLNSVPARLWEGETASGVKCVLYVTRIACLEPGREADFERDLKETRVPSAVVQGFPIRVVL